MVIELIDKIISNLVLDENNQRRWLHKNYSFKESLQYFHWIKHKIQNKESGGRLEPIMWAINEINKKQPWV